MSVLTIKEITCLHVGSSNFVVIDALIGRRLKRLT